jgi:hypothetical protein
MMATRHSCNLKEITVDFSMIAKTLTQLSGGDLVIDGEIAVFDHRRTCLSILRTLFGIVFELSLNRASKTLAISMAFFVIAMIAITHWAFAQEGSISGSVKDLTEDHGIQSVTIRAKGAITSATSGTITSDETGKYPLNMPSLENCTTLASKSEFDVIEIFDTAPDRTLDFPTNPEAELRYRPNLSKPVLSWETGAGKNYLIPALEIPGFILLLNAFDRLVFRNEVEDGKKVYSANVSTFWDHLIHGPWGYDNDFFHVNQILHPYQGSLYHGLARSAGLNFWESLGYTFLGSFLWETAGETTHPSTNDQVASGIAGSLFGEVLFRMASLLLESGGSEPGFWRELGAAALSPPTGFNRLVFGDRFKPVFRSRDPAVFQWVRLGESLVVSNRTSSSITHRNRESLNYSMAYGLPGKPNYSYTRPFDYFQVEVGAVSRDNIFESIKTRGLLLGKKYEVSNSYRGIWGLYGSFDYISPRFFRVSSTAASLGTTFQWWIGPTVAFQGTGLGGIGLGAAGKSPSGTERDYHYGVTERVVLALRLILGDVAMLDMTGREYYISRLAGSKPKGTETISHLEAGLFFRIYGQHALGIQYVTSYRDARYSGRGSVHQRQDTLGLVYALLSDTRFGAVEWRDGHSP